MSEKKLGKTIFVRKKFYLKKKNYWEIFLSERGGCDKCDLFAFLSTKWIDYVEEPMKYQT